MDQLTLYTKPQSRGRTARWMLEELGQPYESVILDFATTAKAPDYLALNPMGKVPCLTHGPRVVTEAAAICCYLADAFPEAGLMPEDRGAFYRWMFFAAGPAEAAMTDRMFGIEVPPEHQVAVGYGSYGRMVDTLEGAVRAARPWLCGDSFSAADLYVGALIGFGLQSGGLEKRAVFSDFWARASDRPAFRRTNEIDEAIAAKGRG